MQNYPKVPSKDIIIKSNKIEGLSTQKYIKFHMKKGKH